MIATGRTDATCEGASVRPVMIMRWGGGLGEPWYVTALPWLGWAVYAVGLAWMVRIYRLSHREPETSFWRYRGR